MEAVIIQSILLIYFQEGQNKKGHGKANDIFVSAEEFSEMLDSAGASGLRMSGSSALSNRDNAGKL